MYSGLSILVIKMTTRLSYHAWITALITFDVLLLTTSASYSEDLPEFVESRQLRRNLANSKFKNNLDWLKNYTLKPIEQSEGTKPPPVWEKEIKIQSDEQNPENDAWDKEMRELTQKQLEKWQISSEKKSQAPDNRKDESGVKSEVNLSEIDFSSGDKSFESEETRRTFGAKFDFEKFDNSSSKSDASATGLTQDERIELNRQSGRWGMSMKDPPQDFKAAVSRLDDTDENKFKETQTQDKKIAKMNRWDEGVGMVDNKLSEPMNNFSSDRWGMSVTSPPSTFLREILSNHLRPISANNSDFDSGLSSLESVAAKMLTHKSLDFDIDNFKKDVTVGDANRVITDRGKETRPLIPIFFIGPSFWSLKMPSDFRRQPVGVIPTALTHSGKYKDENRDKETEEDESQTSSLRNIRLMNTKIIIGEMGDAELTALENCENENRDNNESDNDN